MKKYLKKMTAIFFAAVIAIALLPLLAPQKVYAEDEPAPIQDLYTIDGVNYYNAGSDSFSSNSNLYLKEVLGGGSSEFTWNGVWESGYDRSMSDLWLEVASGMMYGKDYLDDGRFAVAMDLGASQGSPYSSYTIGGKTMDVERYSMSNMKTDDMQSLKTAEEYVYRVAGITKDPASTGYFKSSTAAQKTTVGAIKSYYTSSDFRVAAVYFSNFKIIALLPEDEGNNFVTTYEKTETISTPTVASSLRNNTASTATGSQKISNSYTASIGSSISGSKSFSLSEGLKIGNKFGKGFFNEFSLEVSITATQAVSEGWSESKTTSESNGGEQSISISLPPYTNVMLSQKTTQAERLIRYNCPVAITYDAVIVIYDQNGVRSVNSSPMVFSFTGNARTTLANRYKEWKNESDYPDSEGVRWNYVTAFDRSGDPTTHIAEAIEKVSSYVPMSPTGAELTEKLNLVSGEIDGLMPIYPLTKVKLDTLNIPRYEDDGSYNNYNYLAMKLPVGESTYTKYFTLSGYNQYDVPYFGFSKDFGTWKVVDVYGEESEGDDVPVKISKEKVSGYSTINAVKPGVCYLKYFIDEHTYTTASHPDHFTTNDELLSTAVVKITVVDNRSIDVSGKFEGYVNETPTALDADGKLYAAVCDETGVEIDADVTWEKKEKSGIELSGNLVSFTKPGTYHVRACAEGLRSDWIAITAINRPVVIKVSPVTISKLTAAKKGFAAKWKKGTDVTGYELQYALNSKFTSGKKTVKIANAATVSKKIAKLKAGKKYFVRVRAYKTVAGKKYTSAWSAAKSIKTK